MNSRYFDDSTIQTYTRLETLEYRIPQIRSPVSEEIIYNNSTSKPTMCNIFEQKYMPGFSSLLGWKCQLEEHRKRAQNDLSYVSTDHVSYGLTDVENMLALHKAAATQGNVERELEWFAHTHLHPRSVNVHPGSKSIRNFQTLLFCTRWDAVLEDYGMEVGQLARVCCDRWLSASHVTWFIKQLNEMQSETLCIYNNDVSNIDNLISGQSLVPDGRPKPTSLLFICCVGKSNFSQVFIGSETQPGFHYSLCHLDTITKRITYGDSLGWKVPDILPKYLAAYHAAVYGPSDMRDYEWNFCHEPTSTVGNHSCTARCVGQYPLQTCLSICGPVVIIMTAVACLQRDTFYNLTSANQQVDPHLTYLQTPTKYARYLRKVLASWMAEKSIMLEYIVPKEPTNPLQTGNLAWSSEAETSVSDPEDDTPEIPSLSPGKKGSSEPVKLQIQTADGEKIFQCPCCQKTSKKGFNMKRHILRAHPGQDLKDLDEGNCLCLHCGRRFRRICDLRQHLQDYHATIFMVEQVSFDSMTEFELWKESLEEAESCSFAQYSGFRNKGDYRFRYLQCNRSGMYKQRGVGKRQPKHSGTCKIDNNCTASMKVTCHTNGKVDVECHRTHYGHQKDRELMWLPRKKREEVTAKLGQGISRDRIMNELRDSEGELMRQQELARARDGYDVKKSLGVETVQKHVNEKDSVLAWILQWEAAEENPVLFYKLPGLNPDLNLDLFAEDYIVILQSPFQKHMAQKLASRGVWCDSTQGTNVYDFHLMTLMALNEFGEGFPMAWCISNREDESTIRIFFTKVKENCGDLFPSWFMADAAFMYSNLWTSVFWIAPKKLICPWHVDQAWKEELKNEISDLAVQAQVYKMLRVVLEQQDETSFEDYLQRLLGRLSVSDKTMAFRKYFIKEWVPKMHQWAYCYRTSHCLNPGVFTEAFHIIFKRMYHQGHVNKRVDSCLVHLLKYIRDKTFNWMVKFPRVKVTMRLKLIHDRHLRSMLLSFNQVKQLDDRQCWEVQAEDKNDSHMVERLSITCPVKECRLRCEECNVCVHLFLCNCPDCLINSTICKHIHLIQRLVRLQILIHNEEAEVVGGETEELKRRVCSTLRQMTSMVEAANDTNLEMLRDLYKMLSSSYQRLNHSIHQGISTGQDTETNKRPASEESQDAQIKKTKL
ncbi:uncharacterized protein LOC119739654 isoform X2 [Patiria miniata]|uniref:C2H2-type domain-containing protein n=1 Tax=Patiria miniata TaxID=46514 RepID=A0A914B2N1_PATMI|nr:uncharacterized protein LOC119739654 isoform X2 [Patiria miniata]